MTYLSGRLGAADPLANTDTLIYTVPASTASTVTVYLCNRTTSTVKTRIAISTGAAPAAADYLDYDDSIPANGVLRETGIPLSAGEKVWVRTSAVGVSVQVRGFEEAL